MKNYLDLESMFFLRKNILKIRWDYIHDSPCSILYFDYAFHKDKKTKLIKEYNNINKSQIESIFASWLDTIEGRKFEYNDNEELRIIVSDEGYKILNDNHILALESYNIKVVNFAVKNIIEKEVAV